ncbi:hypothetical protein [Desulfogranum marinum]|uniref:hypothetical protein n=1 Tax=Desulfogranum marinum TaxID=453220 RepID=UPI00196604C9|nr:hypothetical protein [Desulfogranum marinum]MBM9514251.1 hypothetical protein [Desulfogranum marinum]
MPGKGDYSTNTTIIPLGGSGGYRPRNIISAISEIQQFHVIESQGQDIPADFLTLEGSLDLFRIGMRSGFNEGLFIILLFPVFSFYLLPFVLDTSDPFVKAMVTLVPYLALVINTFLCVYISRYYVGNITRRAINSLFIGRGVILLLKGFLIYVFYQILFKLSTPGYVWAVAQKFSNPEKMYYGYMAIVPRLVPLATEIAIGMCLAAIAPYIVAYLLDRWRQRKAQQNMKKIK